MTEPVQTLLQDNNILFTPSGRDYLIKCLNPEHEDTNPSLRVDKVSGIAHCFSCGWKRNLFKHFNVNPPVTSIRLAKLKDKIKELRLSSLELEFPEGNTPFNESFRGISTRTLKEFEAFKTESVEVLRDRIIFPIRNLSGKITAFVARHILSNSNPKYVNYPPHCTLGSYPVKLNGQFNSIVLVEGIFDMLNLYDKGLHNVVCAFGTQSFKNNIQEKLLQYKAQGIHKVFILFDGDTPGREAAFELKPLIEAQYFLAEVINLPDDQDPGDMDQESVNAIREYTQ